MIFVFIIVGFTFICVEDGYCWSQKGWASWYGPKFHGKRTASGEIFNMYALTAAHRTLPFGSYVKVIDLKTKKSVVVRINDRGPFRKRFIIDLSYAAAKKLGMLSKGVAYVKLILLKRYKRKVKPVPIYYTVQISAFSVKKNALKYVKHIKRIIKRRKMSYKVYIRIKKLAGKKVYRVCIGRFKDKNSANRVYVKLKRIGVRGFITVF